MSAPPPRRVMMLGFADCQILDVTGPLEILASANEIDPKAPPAYEITLVAEAAGPLTTTAGISLVAHKAYHDVTARQLAGVHTFMVAGGNGTIAALRSPELIAFVKRAAKAFRLEQNVGTHSARKVYAVDLMQKYGDIDRVRRALNHSSESVTLLYAMADMRLRAKYRKKRRRP